MNRISNVKIILIYAMVIISVPFSSAQDKYQSKIPKNVVVQLNKAKSLREKSNYQRSINGLKSICSKNPGYYQGWYNLGLAYNSLKDYTNAEIAYQKALEIRDKENIKDAMIFNSMGVMYIEKGDYTIAEKFLKIAEQHSSWLSVDQKQKLDNNLGVLYLYKGNHDESQKYFTNASKQSNYIPAQENLKRLEEIKQSGKK